MQKPSIFNVVGKKDDYFIFSTLSEFTFHVWKNAATDYHSHDNYIEIFVLLEGTISNTMLGERKILTAGDIGLISPGVPHIHNRINNDNVQLLNITCHHSIAKTLFNEIYHRKLPNTSIKKLNKTELKLIKQFQKTLSATSSDSDYNTVLASFCIYLLGCFKTLKSEKVALPEPFQQFINYLHEADLAYVTIKELYQKSHYSQRTLSSYFKKYMNQTLVQYVSDIKLNRAKNLIRSTDLSITEIAMTSGFNSITHFNHLFKNKFGISPKSYRSSLQP